jgi:hypothetical protein
VTTWRNKFQALEAKSMDDMISALKSAVVTLEAMRKDGVTLEPSGGTGDDDTLLVTTDPQVGRKYDMHPEEEIWRGDGSGDEAKTRGEYSRLLLVNPEAAMSP